MRLYRAVTNEGQPYITNKIHIIPINPMKTLLFPTFLLAFASCTSNAPKPAPPTPLKDSTVVAPQEPEPEKEKIHTSQKGVTPYSPKFYNGNIFMAFEDSVEKQFTDTGTDLFPVYLKSKRSILYVSTYGGSQLMLLNVDTRNAKMITDKSPFEDFTEEGSEFLNRIDDLNSSLDEKYALFTTEESNSNDVAVKVNIQTGKWEKLFPADYLHLVRKGEYKGYYIVGQSDLYPYENAPPSDPAYYSRDIYFKIRTPFGKIFKEFKTEAECDVFAKKNGIYEE